MATRTATGPNGEKITFRSASDSEGNQQWIQVATPTPKKSQPAQDLEAMKRPDINIPEGQGLPVGMTQAMIDSAQKGNVDQNKLIESIMNDPKALESFASAQDESSLSAIAGSFGTEVKALGEGISDVMDDNLPEWLSNALNYKPGGKNFDTSKERMEDRGIEMAKNRMESDTRSLASPMASMAGGAAPYLLSDIALTPVTSRALKAISGTAKFAGKGLQKGVTKLDDILKKTPDATSDDLGILQLLDKAKAPLQKGTESMVDTAMNIQNRKPTSLDVASNIKEMARAPITGAIEGTAHYDKTAEQGAMESFAGQAIPSMTPGRNLLGRVPSELNAAQKEALKNAKRMGIRTTPGMQTGVKSTQADEAGFRSEPKTRNYMSEIDTHNTGIMGDEAMRAMGIDDADFRTMTKDKLKAHMDNLSDEYQALEKATTGEFTPESRGRIGRILKDTQPTQNANTSKAAGERHKVLKDIANEMNDKTKGGKFDGENYQGMSQRIKDELDQAYTTGDKQLQRQLKAMQKELDDSMASGMDKATAGQWKDANERYAMSNLVMEKGMDANLGIDMGKLQGELMGPDAVRTVTGTGGRIKNLQDLASINELSRATKGQEGWTGSGVDQGIPGKKSLTRKVLTSQGDAGTSMGTRALMNTYMSGYPSVTGLTGLPRGAIAKGGRALAQEGGVQERAGTILKKTPKSLKELLESMGIN